MVTGRIFLKYHKCNSLPSLSSPYASLMEIEEKYPFFIFMVPTRDRTTLLVLGFGFRWS
ncbi:hypothetical protein Peur_051807 [Populus x canadensis]